ncbi:MAG: pyruvate kinase [Nitrososphaerales archaeon]
MADILVPDENFFSRRRTKIVCTIGPATSSERMLERLVRTGMDCARLNFSHGAPPEHLLIIKSIRKISERTGKQVAILQDLPGPKFRIGNLKNGSVNIKKGSLITLTTKKVEEGTEEVIPLRSQDLPRYVIEGSSIFLSDGSIKLKVLRVTRGQIQCKCEIGGVLLSGKGVNIPQLRRGLETFTPQDKNFLAFGIEHGVDLVAVSFVRKASDIQSVKNFVSRYDSKVSVIAKIEKREAVGNIAGIISVSDCLMVARGDLGVENPIEQIPELQKEIISGCNARGVPVITATQMLESMVNNPRPTRAEVTDVANAILDGTDAVMLSEETAMGQYPLECVRMLDSVAHRAEERMLSRRKFVSLDSLPNDDLREAMSSAVAQISTAIGAKAIIARLISDRFVSKISRFRPYAPIIGEFATNAELRRSKIIWGVFPTLASVNGGGRLLGRESMPTAEKLVQRNLFKEGDVVVLVSENSSISNKQKGITLRVIKLEWIKR